MVCKSNGAVEFILGICTIFAFTFVIPNKYSPYISFKMSEFSTRICSEVLRLSKAKTKKTKRTRKTVKIKKGTSRIKPVVPKPQESKGAVFLKKPRVSSESSVTKAELLAVFKPKRIAPLPKLERRDLKWTIRRFVPLTTTVLGLGYILPNIAIVIILGYILSQTSITSLQMITQISGIILFLMASIVMMVMGAALIVGGMRYNKRKPSPRGTIFLGVLFASFYLLCLGVGSALLLSEINMNVGLLIVGPIFIMVSAAVYMVPSLISRLIGHTLGIIGGFLLAIVTFNFQALKIATGWDVPFPGMFMSLTVMEGIAMILGSIAVAIYSSFSGRSEKPVAYVLLSIVGLVYGIGVFIGPLILSFSFLDIVWKAPWLGPLYGLPSWVVDTTIFWSASLVLLEIGGILLILSSCLGFTFAAQEFSRIYAVPAEVSEVSPKRRKSVVKRKAGALKSQ
jgi:hypothetical protein